MNISHLTPTFADIKTWVRAATVTVNQLITGKQDKSDNLTSLSGLDLTGHSGDAVVVTAGEDGFELVAGGGGGGTTTNALTMNNGGAGAASGTTFDGSVARTISYNTVGAAASGHNHTGVYQPADTTLDAFAAYNTNGLIAQTAADTFAGRTLTGPAAGITVTNGNGVSGNPTLALSNDLSALEAMSGTGIVARTASETYAQRTITQSTGITVTNGSGVAGNPTIALTNVPYVIIHFFGSVVVTATTVAVDSATYVAPLPLQFWLDRTTFPATHYRIVGRGRSSEAAQTVSFQLATPTAPTTAIHTGGNDVTGLTNANTDIDSGWLTLDDAGTGLWKGCVAIKGSNATVDFITAGPLQVMFKIAT